jgi:hypothetical protein
VGPRAGLEECRKSSPPPGIRSRDRPARKEWPYQLSYTGPNVTKNISELSVVLALSMEACNFSYTG